VGALEGAADGRGGTAAGHPGAAALGGGGVNALSVRCPKCGAEPNQRCVTASGPHALKPHHKRGNAAAEAAAYERRAERDG
jgi:hypothetical protein